jgi:hypothetical protein
LAELVEIGELADVMNLDYVRLPAELASVLTGDVDRSRYPRDRGKRRRLHLPGQFRDGRRKHWFCTRPWRRPARSSVLGPAARKIALPDRLDGPTVAGEVLLPLNVCWSGRRRFALNNRSDRARVYEQVLREGTTEDIQRYVDADLLVDLWDELVLPAAVVEAWAAWLRQHAYVDHGC